MNAPREFDHDFDDATIGDDDIEELGDTVGDDEDEGDNEINYVVDCGNDDFGDDDDDLFLSLVYLFFSYFSLFC